MRARFAKFGAWGKRGTTIKRVMSPRWNARAASAGLTKFIPVPPNTSLPSTTPKLMPSAACHNGVVGGRISGNRRPVTIAVTPATGDLYWMDVTVKNDRVYPVGLYDLDRKPRRVGRGQCASDPDSPG